MEQHIFLKLTFEDGRNMYHGVNRILILYDILCDYYLGLDTYAMIGISCACIY